MSADRRLLLIELVSADPWVYPGRYFPHLAGLAEQHGVAATWLCLGVRWGHEPDGAGFRQFAHLEPADEAVLRAELARLAPSHVVLSETLSGDGFRAVFGDGGRPALLVTSDRPVPEPGVASAYELAAASTPSTDGLDRDERRWARWVHWKLARTDWFLDWLGEPDPATPDRGRYLVGAASPSFACRVANDAARAFRPALLLAGGVACDHRADVRTNPCFRGVDLGTDVVDAGCSFCSYYRGPTSDPRHDAVALAATQLAAIRRELGPEGRFFGTIDMHDVRLFRRLDEVCGCLEELQFPPCTFVVSPRIDRFLDAPLEAVLPRFERGGWRLSVYRMGGESLLDGVNERFNKRVTRAQLDEARARWQRLLHDHPGAFDYDGTLGAITFTPWSTLAELIETFEVALARGFAEEDVWVYTPLELQRDTAITELARHDGLTTADFTDPALLYKVFLNHIAPGSLVPWRFADPLAGRAFGLIVRYYAAATRDRQPDAVFDGDAPYSSLRARVDALGPTRPSPALYAASTRDQLPKRP